jgi:cysteine-S-conjugate beta-lyase
MGELVVPELADLQRRRSEKWAGHAPGVIAATIAEMDFAVAEPIARVLHDAIGRSDLGYVPQAPTSLKEAFAGFAERRFGWRVDPEQVTPIPEVLIGLIELCRVLAPGGSVAFATAGYPPFLQQLPPAGFSTVLIPLRADGWFDLDRLATELRNGLKVLVLANPHNPTGRVLPREELEQIADLCAEYGAWVLADEIHAPLVLPGATHVPWLEVSDSARQCGISLTSASKAFNLAGLKAAVMVTASERARDVVGRLPFGTDQVGLLGVIAAEAAFTEGDAWLDALIRQLDANRALLAGLLATELPQVTWTPPDATYLAWLDLSKLGLGDEPEKALLDKAKVALGSGRHYDPDSTGFVRLNFGTSPEIVTEMVTRIATAAGH